LNRPYAVAAVIALGRALKDAPAKKISPDSIEFSETGSNSRSLNSATIFRSKS
jgi:hypothetical protein